MEALRECRLTQPKPLAQFAQSPWPEHVRKFRVGHWLGIGIGQRRLFDLFVGDLRNTVPIGLVSGLGVNPWPIPNKLFFHGGSPSLR